MVCTSTNLSTQVSLGQIFHMRHYRTYQASLKRDIPMTNLCDLLPRANQVSSHVEWKQLANVLHDNCRPYACNHKRTAPTQILQCEFQENAQMHRFSCPPRKDFDADPTFGRCLSLKLLRCAAASLCRASEQTNVDKNLRQCLPVQASSSLRQGIAVTHFSSPGNIAHTSSMITGGGNLQKENLREDSSLL